jgi:hypothetical protein
MPAFQEIYKKHFDTLIAEGNTFPINEDAYGNDIPLRARLKGWENRCLNLIEKTFGRDNPYYSTLESYLRSSYTVKRIYCIETLKSAKAEYETLSPTNSVIEAEKGVGPLVFLERICTRFHLVTRQMRERYDERATLDVNDEYDVQDLMYALLRVNFDNIRKEEWTPSYAGSCSRMDFLLKNEGIVIETKKTREGLTAKILADELIVDIERYQAHQDCKMLLCFIYDPDGRLASPETLELDMSKPHGNIEVKVIVSPKGV